MLAMMLFQFPQRILLTDALRDVLRDSFLLIERAIFFLMAEREAEETMLFKLFILEIDF